MTKLFSNFSLNLFLAFGLVLVSAQTVWASGPPAWSSGLDACTTKESWTFGGGIPKAYRDKIQAATQGFPQAMVLFSNGYSLRQNVKNSEAKALGDYFMARGLYGLKQVHIATKRFNSLIADTAAPWRVRIQALDCVARIHETFPHLGLDIVSADALRTIPFAGLTADQRYSIDDQLLIFFQDRLSDSNEDREELRGPRAILSANVSYDSFLKAQIAGSKNDSNGVILNLEKVLKEPKLSPYLRSKLDSMHLMLGQAYYDLAKFDKASLNFHKIGYKSNLLPDALTDIAWSNLLTSHYDQAMSSAKNLLLGNLAHTFSPEAYTVSAIALIETCHYPEAVQSVRTFRQAYSTSYYWLNAWKAHGGEKVYSHLVAYLKKQERIPDRVAVEWLRSPLFIAHQDELNLLIDEKDIQKKLDAQLLKAIASKHPLRVSFQELRRSFDEDFSLQEIDKRRQLLVAAIDVDLGARSERMLTMLSNTWENNQLVEVESLNQLGDKIMADNGAKDVYKEKDLKKADKTALTSLDWGKAPTTTEDGEWKGEVWEDELGFLKTSVADACKHDKDGVNL